jgi:Fe-S cluster assembly iron-binding protein IscA
MRKLKLTGIGVVLTLAIASCKKSDSSNVSAAQIQIGQAVSSAAPLTGSIKGTMLTGQTYTITGDVTVNAGDTLLIQKGVTVNVKNASALVVNGTLVSLGTKDAPVTITDPSRAKTTGSSTATSDSAYAGGWTGIYCGPTCPLLVIKWTHLDFAGAGIQTIPFTGPSVGDQYCIYFGNPNGNFILEDSWIYGTPDDAVRFYGGHVNIMRNTLEKCGGTGGDGFNAKGGTQGNMAYNLIIGGATNGTKSANDGGIQPQCMIAMYNNTYINDGFRNTGTFGARSGSIEVENNSRALVYNNLVVDCAFGVRIAGGNNVTAKVYLADTTGPHAGDPITQTAYGYNYFYGDDVSITNQFVPTNVAQAVVTHPQATGIPNLAAFLGAAYTFGKQYDGTSLVGQNNPMFVNYPLPNLNYKTQASVDAYNFHLQSNSPAIGKGFQGFSAIANVPVDPTFGATAIVGPGKDIGCYQADGTGNLH